MKNALPVIFCFLFVNANSQTATGYSYQKPSEGSGAMGKAYLSEQKKTGGISYPDVTISIDIRKEKDFSNNHVSKSIFFTGTTIQGPCEGFIDESEIEEAIHALKYISDSLLAIIPENEIHFAKRFTNSNFVIYASFVPKSGTLFAKADWDINLVLNETEADPNQGSVHLKKTDLNSLIQMLIMSKDKLKTF